jgi:hypothetical protein
VKALAPIRGGVPDAPNVASAHWGERIGILAPAGQDRWWTAASVEEGMVVGKEMAAQLFAWGLPALAVLRTNQDVIDLWRSGRSPGLTELQRARFLAKLVDAVA